MDGAIGIMREFFLRDGERCETGVRMLSAGDKWVRSSLGIIRWVRCMCGGTDSARSRGKDGRAGVGVCAVSEREREPFV